MQNPGCRVPIWSSLLIIACAVTGCDLEPEPLAVEHADFVGVWERGQYGEGTSYRYLQISASGYLTHARFEKTEQSIHCLSVGAMPVKKISELQITTTFLWLFSMDYEVNEQPWMEDGSWKMTIDGEELTRTDDRLEGFDYTWSCDDGLVREPTA